MEKEKTCKNCKYYSQHYSKQNTIFSIVSCGHCMHTSNKKMKAILCENWENNSIQKEERKKCIMITLENMAKNIENIAILLKDDTQIEK